MNTEADFYDLLRRPVITEKATNASENGSVVFEVSMSATKPEIKKAVETLFKVKVINVTTSIVKGKTKRNRFGMYKKSNYKKAFVSLSEDSDIQFEGIN